MRHDKSPFLRTMLYLLLVTWLIGSVQQGIAESAGDIFTGQTGGKPWPERAGSLQAGKHIQLAGLSYSPDLKGYTPQEPGTREPISVQVSRKIQIMLIGGGLLIIGTFFIPHLIPQFTGYHERLYRFFENTVKTYKTILQNSQSRLSPRSARTRSFSENPKKTKTHVPLLENKDAAMRYYTIRCENILSPAYSLPMPKFSTIGIIRKFFQQSGFAFTKISDTE